jgi:hypothetical protein
MAADAPQITADGSMPRIVLVAGVFESLMKIGVHLRGIGGHLRSL